MCGCAGAIVGSHLQPLLPFGAPRPTASPSQQSRIAVRHPGQWGWRVPRFLEILLRFVAFSRNVLYFGAKKSETFFLQSIIGSLYAKRLLYGAGARSVQLFFGGWFSFAFFYFLGYCSVTPQYSHAQCSVACGRPNPGQRATARPIPAPIRDIAD